MLFNEPKLLKCSEEDKIIIFFVEVSVLFNEPKLLKSFGGAQGEAEVKSFSALQRAEIAEMIRRIVGSNMNHGFSALQRAEIAEIVRFVVTDDDLPSFSALQRAEIAEIVLLFGKNELLLLVSVLFNEPKLLKSESQARASILKLAFQCSSTSRNC